MNEPPSTSDLGFNFSFWQWVKRFHWSVAAPILLIVFTGVFAWQIFLSSSEVDQGLAQLSAAYREARPLEARLAGFSYAPYSNGVVNINENQFKQAERLLLAQADKGKTPAALYALGKFHLANRKFDEALRWFDAALKGEPNNAALHNDMGIALMEKAWLERANNHSLDFTPSQVHWEQAIKSDRNALEPLFNLALSQQRQGLWERAEESWKTYLQNDMRSSWAAEAKRYLAEIEEKKKTKIKETAN